MKISLLIPAYNCATTIAATLDSALQQTVPPDEILVMDDGSTDDTVAILRSYIPKITVFRQLNAGVGSAFNALCAKAQGDLVAFLGSDDLWHPRYLEVQRRLFEQYPTVVASFTGHVNFPDTEKHVWKGNPCDDPFSVELIPPLQFFRCYNHSTGPFTCFSYCCIPRKVLRHLGDEPFKERAAEDSYCCSLLALVGPVLYASAPLVAYRVRTGSLSSNHVWTFQSWVHVFEILEDRYRDSASRQLLQAFHLAFASKRRAYAKLLMSANRTAEARTQLLRSVGNSLDPMSMGKSLGLLLATYMPRRLQPVWPTSFREQSIAGKA